jgi:hypothetical protein
MWNPGAGFSAVGSSVDCRIGSRIPSDNNCYTICGLAVPLPAVVDHFAIRRFSLMNSGEMSMAASGAKLAKRSG